MSRNLLNKLLAIMAAVWLLALVVAYYARYHNPLGADRIAELQYATWKVEGIEPSQVIGALLDGLRNLLAAGGLVLAGGAMGRVLMPRLDKVSASERVSLQGLLGLGLLALPVLMIGMLGLFPAPWLAWIVMVGLLAALRKPLLGWLADCRNGLRMVLGTVGDGLSRWLRRGVIVLLAVALVLAFAPATKWDSLTYHLAGPAYYLKVGRIASFPENHFLNFPQTISMLYLWLLNLAGPPAAALLHGVIGWLLILLILGLAYRHERPLAGWLAVTALLSAETIRGLLAWAYNDLALMAFIFAALMLLLIWDDVGRRNVRYLVGAGVFVGLAMGTKYTAAGGSAGMGVLALWLARRDGAKAMFRAVGVLGGVAALVFAPWLIKNVMTEGNPIAPFGTGTIAFDALDQWYYLRPGTGASLVRLPAIPLEATLRGREDSEYQASTGPLLLGLLPLVIAHWRQRPDWQRRLIISLLAFILPTYLIWLYGVRTSWFLTQTRLLYPIFPALAVVVGLGAAELRHLHLRFDLKPLVALAVIITLIGSLLDSAVTFIASDSLRAIVGLQNEEDYLRQALPDHYPAMEAVNDLPPGARVLFLWEPRIYYCQRECLPDSMIDLWWHDRQTVGDPAAIARQWADQGMTHVLIWNSGGQFLFTMEPFDPLTAEDMEALKSLQGNALIPIWEGFGYTLCELRVED